MAFGLFSPAPAGFTSASTTTAPPHRPLAAFHHLRLLCRDRCSSPLAWLQWARWLRRNDAPLSDAPGFRRPVAGSGSLPRLVPHRLPWLYAGYSQLFADRWPGWRRWAASWLISLSLALSASRFAGQPARLRRQAAPGRRSAPAAGALGHRPGAAGHAWTTSRGEPLGSPPCRAASSRT